MPTIRDVAKRAGVAPITVSRVINNSGYVSEEARLRVQEAIQALQYIPNALSQSLRFKKTNTIALIVSDITNPFWTTVTRGVEDASSEHGFSVILCNTDEKQAKLENYVNMLLQRQTDGFLLVPTSSDVEVVRKIQRQRAPLVVVDRSLTGIEVDVVRSDSEGGAYAMTQYLIGLGHRRIAMLAGPEGISTSQHRVMGYKRAYQDAGLPMDAALISYGGYDSESGYQRTLQLMQQVSVRPTALFAGNNVIAVGVMHALYHLGLPVPEAMSVAGFDDMPLSLLAEPFLTVVAQSPYQLGVQATRLLIDLLMGREKPDNREVVLPVELIIRQSCRMTTADAVN